MCVSSVRKGAKEEERKEGPKANKQKEPHTQWRFAAVAAVRRQRKVSTFAHKKHKMADRLICSGERRKEDRACAKQNVRRTKRPENEKKKRLLHRAYTAVRLGKRLQRAHTHVHMYTYTQSGSVCVYTCVCARATEERERGVEEEKYLILLPLSLSPLE